MNKSYTLPYHHIFLSVVTQCPQSFKKPALYLPYQNSNASHGHLKVVWTLITQKYEEEKVTQ